MGNDQIEAVPVGAEKRTGPSYTPVRSVLRAFLVLEEVNRLGQARLPDIVRGAGLPRATVVRMLDTLEVCELVHRDQDNASYQVTPRVRLLSSGFNFNLWLESVTSPILNGLLKKIGWPSDLLMLRGREFLVTHSNRSQSIVNVNSRFIGMRSPIIGSASGRAYLAWCPEEERERLIRSACNLQDQGRIRGELEQTRAAGYGWRDASLPPKVGAIAVPVMVGNRVMCCLDTVFLPQIATTAQVANKCLGPLRDAATEIADRIGDNMPSGNP